MVLNFEEEKKNIQKRRFVEEMRKLDSEEAIGFLLNVIDWGRDEENRQDEAFMQSYYAMLSTVLEAF